MPLLDHFHPPLEGRRYWDSFHGGWASEIRSHLNRKILPPNYFAEATSYIGGRVEIDVPTIEERSAAPNFGNGTDGGVAVEVWAPPTTALTMPGVFPDEIEVRVFDSVGGPTLVAAIELVSPGNKDRPETRRAFAAKCASLLQAGVGLVVVDVVTSYRANMHDELIDVMRQADGFRFQGSSLLYATAYRPQRTKVEEDQIVVWFFPLVVGEKLPTVPLALRRGPTLPLDLELTYTTAREASRL
jgi:hypothetical protein